MGKTVLAARLAERMASRLDGVKTLRLTPSTTAQEVLRQIANFPQVNNARFNLPLVNTFSQTVDQSVDIDTKAGQLLEILSRLRLLLVFDNCEDILPEGTVVSQKIAAKKETAPLPTPLAGHPG